jgi:hypothetical protein
MCRRRLTVGDTCFYILGLFRGSRSAASRKSHFWNSVLHRSRRWRPIANGKQINTGALTAAHKTLPFGTVVLVTNKRNGRSVVVRINDHGPFIKDRIIDLTPAGARAIGMDGLAQVDVTPISYALFRSVTGGIIFARLRDELLDAEIFYSPRDTQFVIESWRRHYNSRDVLGCPAARR